MVRKLDYPLDTVNIYVCEKCGGKWATLEKAEACEAKMAEKYQYERDKIWNIGDFVKVDYDDYECSFDYFGRIVDIHEEHHVLYPVVMTLEYNTMIELEHAETIQIIPVDELIEMFQKMLGDDYTIKRRK